MPRVSCNFLTHLSRDRSVNITQDIINHTQYGIYQEDLEGNKLALKFVCSYNSKIVLYIDESNTQFYNTEMFTNLHFCLRDINNKPRVLSPLIFIILLPSSAPVGNFS